MKDFPTGSSLLNAIVPIPDVSDSFILIHVQIYELLGTNMQIRKTKSLHIKTLLLLRTFPRVELLCHLGHGIGPILQSSTFLMNLAISLPYKLIQTLSLLVCKISSILVK